MQILKINKKFYDKLDKEEKKKILRIYGHADREAFLSYVISRLNEEYEFINIDKYGFLSKEEESVYHQYNGYIEASFEEYDNVTVSFTTISGKGGNVWFNQQVMPMITSKLEENKKFLISDRIKKICLLTTHKSEKMTAEENKVEEDSSIQMNVNFANTIGFEFLEIFTIKNLNIDGRYRDIEEIIDYTRFLQKTKRDNSQFSQLRNGDDGYVASFDGGPQGQEVKFFSLKVLAALHLLRGEKIDISQALEQTGDKTIKVLNDYIKFLSTIEISKYPIFSQDFELEEKDREKGLVDVEEEIVSEEKEKPPRYKIEPIYDYNSRGRKIFKTKRRNKIESMELHNYLCGCDDGGHIYFTSGSTNKEYTEGHHMIPMEYQHQYWNDFKINLDCPQNIIPLCPHCHGKIHKATKLQKWEIISDIYNRNKKNLEEVDNDLTLEKLASFYNVYIY